MVGMSMSRVRCRQREARAGGASRRNAVSALPALVLCLTVSYAGMPVVGPVLAPGDEIPALVASAKVEDKPFPPLLGALASHTVRPNVLLITTDDQRADELRYMRRTVRRIVEQGTMLQGVAPHPLCCPARAQWLTGQYAHNNDVRTNVGPYGGWDELDKSQTIATWLQTAGYTTIFLGKYLNGYRKRHAIGRREPGWARWHPTVEGLYDYQDFTVSHNGSFEQVRDSYQTDYFAALARREIRRAVKRDKPFFLWQSFMAPHPACTEDEDYCWGPPTSARRHRSLFTETPLRSMRSPAFNEHDVSDKPREYRLLPRLTEERIDRLIWNNRQRLRALAAVDEAVASMLDTLRAIGELGNTLVIVTSDNGFLLGEHRDTGKTVGYEPSLRVPLVLRGPGIPADRRLATVGTSLDVAATIVATARAHPTLTMDGRALQPVARRETRGAGTMLIQGGPARSARMSSGGTTEGFARPATATSSTRLPASGSCTTGRATRTSSTAGTAVALTPTSGANCGVDFRSLRTALEIPVGGASRLFRLRASDDRRPNAAGDGYQGCAGRWRSIATGSAWVLVVTLIPLASSGRPSEAPKQEGERTASPTVPVSPGSRRPNIVLITTDDQRANDIRFMPRVRDLIGRRGTTFRGFSPDPLCCPARASILTGQLAHNHGCCRTTPRTAASRPCQLGEVWPSGSSVPATTPCSWAST